ncbi:MAG: ABC-F family ATP-binding cassette domain-containing protein [Clostridia bacterium]|nr:ABC-F family ATP-binding cassette domain-containing protein [Clostridia bacterium]
MSLVEISDLSFSYPDSSIPVFEHACVRFDTNWNLGLVGRNGRGKTTLLRLLMQKETEYSGTIKGVPPCVYFPAPVPNADMSAAAILRSISPEAADWEIDRELSLIGLDSDTAARAFSALSSGERTKVLLAALFLVDGALPLIDEPTNHLDAAGRAAVAKYLRRKRGFILVSHDRTFLDSSVDHILALSRADIDVQKGTFSTWFRKFSEQQQSELQRNTQLRREIARLEDAAGRASAWSAKAEKEKQHLSDGQKDRGFASHRAAKMTRRAKSIAARSTRAADEKRTLLRNLEKTDVLHLRGLQHPKNTLIRLSDVVPFYGDAAVCTPVSFEVQRGDRLLLSGANGSGKSTVFSTIIGMHESYAGKLEKASGLRISYVPQNTRQLHGTVEAYARAVGADLSLMLSIAHKLGVCREDFGRDLASLSEGQKKKMMIARSLSEPAHLYVWDEPLNYLDIYARVQIEKMIQEADTAMLLVEHDQTFRRAVGTGEVQLT